MDGIAGEVAEGMRREAFFEITGAHTRASFKHQYITSKPLAGFHAMTRKEHTAVPHGISLGRG